MYAGMYGTTAVPPPPPPPPGQSFYVAPPLQPAVQQVPPVPTQVHGGAVVPAVPMTRSESQWEAYPTSSWEAYRSHGTTYYNAPRLPAVAPVLAPAAPPTLPSLRPAPAVAAAPPVGGVSATLDYDLDTMADFLATMATGVVLPAGSAPVTAGFVKFVHQVLTATRLPKATIVLALVYLSQRCADPAAYRSVLASCEREPATASTPAATLGVAAATSADEAARVLLVVALLLANKFQDDNTFTNRSWGEATGLRVAVITREECNWLRAVKWSLHLVASDLRGWDKWCHCWDVYCQSKTAGRRSEPASPCSPVGSTGSASSRRPLSSAAYYSPMRASYTAPGWYASPPELPRPDTTASAASAAPSAPFASYFQQQFLVPPQLQPAPQLHPQHSSHHHQHHHAHQSQHQHHPQQHHQHHHQHHLQHHHHHHHSHNQYWGSCMCAMCNAASVGTIGPQPSVQTAPGPRPWLTSSAVAVGGC